MSNQLLRSLPTFFSDENTLETIPASAYPPNAAQVTTPPTRLAYQNVDFFPSLTPAPTHLQPSGRSVRPGMYREKTVRLRYDQLGTFWTNYVGEVGGGIRLRYGMLERDFRLVPDAEGVIQEEMNADVEFVDRKSGEGAASFFDGGGADTGKLLDTTGLQERLKVAPEKGGLLGMAKGLVRKMGSLSSATKEAGSDIRENFGPDRFGGRVLGPEFDFRRFIPSGSKLVGLTSSGYQETTPSSPIMPVGGSETPEEVVCSTRVKLEILLTR